MRRAERRVRPNIQQTCPKTCGNIGLRIAARRLTKTLPRVSYREEAYAALACRKKVSMAGYEVDNGHYRKLRHEHITSVVREHQDEKAIRSPIVSAYAVTQELTENVGSAGHFDDLPLGS